jgi:catalase
MASVPPAIQHRQIAHFKRADADYGERIERGLAQRAGR